MRHGIGARILAFSPTQYCAQPEYLLLSVSPVKSRPFLFTVIYRSPKLGHLTAFQADFERFHPSFSTAVIVGDFNIDLKRSSHDTDNLINFCSSNHLYIVPYHDSFTSFSHTRINHCLLSDQSQLVSHHQEPLSFLSSHDLIEVTLNLLVHRTPPRPISIRDYSKFDLLSFLQSLQNLD